MQSLRDSKRHKGEQYFTFLYNFSGFTFNDQFGLFVIFDCILKNLYLQGLWRRFFYNIMWNLFGDANSQLSLFLCKERF